MAPTHNVFIHAINSIWRNAPLVKPEDEHAFAGYSLCCLAAVHNHHHSEETFLFPFFQTKLDMTHNIEQHEALHAGMDILEEYMTKFSLGLRDIGEKTRELLKALADPLMQHLHDDVGFLRPSTVIC